MKNIESTKKIYFIFVFFEQIIINAKIQKYSENKHWDIRNLESLITHFTKNK